MAVHATFLPETLNHDKLDSLWQNVPPRIGDEPWKKSNDDLARVCGAPFPHIFELLGVACDQNEDPV